jgi:hypothetical protein
MGSLVVEHRKWVLRAFALVVLTAFVAAPGAQTLRQQHQGVSTDAAADQWKPLEDRITRPPEAFLKMFPHGTLTTHVLTPAERKRLQKALHSLTPLQQEVLKQRLASISFVDGMPNTALTYPVKQDDPETKYNITIRGSALDESLSHLLTWKEKTCFDFANSPLTLKVDAGKMNAIVYILLHEATHVVDLSMGLSAGRHPSLYSASRIWQSNRGLQPEYRDPLLESVLFRSDKTTSIAKAPAVYTALSKSPFVSLYGSNNREDDLAELVAWYDLSQKLDQPYQIQLWDGNRMVFHYDPMQNPQVRQRFPDIHFFYQ